MKQCCFFVFIISTQVTWITQSMLSVYINDAFSSSTTHQHYKNESEEFPPQSGWTSLLFKQAQMIFIYRLKRKLQHVNELKKVSMNHNKINPTLNTNNNICWCLGYSQMWFFPITKPPWLDTLQCKTIGKNASVLFLSNYKLWLANFLKLILSKISCCVSLVSPWSKQRKYDWGCNLF